jgi:Na+-translocating ferredoxin:NAD+ oxidoreductase RnfC subunit
VGASSATLQDRIRAAGVVGAGGAGFPTHVKAGARAEVVIANGAECEPLLHKDFELMVHAPERVVAGLRLLMQATGARQGILGVKAKNAGAIAALTAALDDDDVRIHTLGDFYPSGDEYILVYEATGRLIPPQGIPLDVGVVVNNVETLYNIAAAAEGRPVTGTWITVAGAVARPVTFVAPVGLSYREAIDLAGGATTRDCAVFVGGIMMGSLADDLDAPLTKTCAGLIVLPAVHELVRRVRQPEPAMHRIGRSACDQCSLCTELCPRYTLGYEVEPHRVMRSLSFTPKGGAMWNQFAALCCACGLCTLYACPEALYPKEACDRAKQDLKAQEIRWSGRREVEPHPMYEYRRTPLKQLIRRLGIAEYDRPAPFATVDIRPRRVVLPLQQNLGVPAEPVVAPGDRVAAGQPVAEIPAGALGARLHASIGGIVREVDGRIVIESE